MSGWLKEACLSFFFWGGGNAIYRDVIYDFRLGWGKRIPSFLPFLRSGSLLDS